MTRRPFTEFLYRLLLVAYPSDFRRTLGGEAAGAFGQLHRDEWREAGIKGVAGLWRRSVFQVVGYGPYSAVDFHLLSFASLSWRSPLWVTCRSP